MEEIWRPVKGYEGIYEVSNIGNVRSLSRKDSRGRFHKGRYISTRVNPHTGYPVAHLCLDGEKKLREVHRLVAEAFIPNPENKREVDHINTIRNDNRVENLRWVTSRENKYNPITNKRMSEWQSDGKSPALGRTLSKEHYQKLKDGLDKWRGENGEPFTGRKHSEETKRKIRESCREQLDSGRRKPRSGAMHHFSKPVCQYTLDGEYIKSYVSIIDAVRATNGDKSGIQKCCVGKGKTSGGYLWEFAKEVVQ